MIDYFFNFEEIRWLLAWESLLLLAMCVLFFWCSKIFISLSHKGLKVDYHLLEKDNPALAVTVAGYFFAVGIILYHIVSSPTHPDWQLINSYWSPVLDAMYWFLIGSLLLFLAGIINDRFLLPQFKNYKEIIEDCNVGAGVTVAGSYIASAFIISVIIAYGNEGGLVLQTGLVGLYFLILQVALIGFSKIYTRLLPYNLHDSIEKDNPASGVGYGLSLVAMGILISYPLRTTGNIWILLFWFVNGVVLLLLTRILFNYFLFHKADLNREIEQDHNWGIALIEGVSLIVIALLITSSF